MAAHSNELAKQADALFRLKKANYKAMKIDLSASATGGFIMSGREQAGQRMTKIFNK